MKVLNGNAVSSVISEKMCGQTNKQTNKQTNTNRQTGKNSIVTGTGDYNKQTGQKLDQSQDIVTGNAYVRS